VVRRERSEERVLDSVEVGGESRVGREDGEGGWSDEEGGRKSLA